MVRRSRRLARPVQEIGFLRPAAKGGRFESILSHFRRLRRARPAAGRPVGRRSASPSPRARLRLALLQIGAQLLGEPAPCGRPLWPSLCRIVLSLMVPSRLATGRPLFRDSQHCGLPCPQNRLRTGFHRCALPCAAGIDMAEAAAFGGCGSSVVEHSLGKGEVESSILSRSTSLSLEIIEPLDTQRLSVHSDVTNHVTKRWT